MQGAYPGAEGVGATAPPLSEKREKNIIYNRKKIVFSKKYFQSGRNPMEKFLGVVGERVMKYFQPPPSHLLKS